MRIRVTQSGGREGAEERELVSLDTDRLHAQAAGRVRGRLAAEGFFSLPAHPTAGAGGPRYRIVVEEGGDRHTRSRSRTTAPRPPRRSKRWWRRWPRRPARRRGLWTTRG